MSEDYDINLEIEENYITWFKIFETTKNKIDFSLYYDSNSSKIIIGEDAKKIGAKEPKQLISNIMKWISVSYSDDDEFKTYMKESEIDVKEMDLIPVIEIIHNKQIIQLTIEQIIKDFFNEIKDLINETLSKDKNSTLIAKVLYKYKYNSIQISNLKKCLELSGIRVKTEDVDDMSSMMDNLRIKQTENTVKNESKTSKLSSSQQSPSSQRSPSRLQQQPQQLPPPQSPPYFVTHHDNNEPVNISYDNCSYDNPNTTYANCDFKLEDILFPNFLPDDELVFNNNNNNNNNMENNNMENNNMENNGNYYHDNDNEENDNTV